MKFENHYYTKKFINLIVEKYTKFLIMSMSLLSKSYIKLND